jgi:hypothetical protein
VATASARGNRTRIHTFHRDAGLRTPEGLARACLSLNTLRLVARRSPRSWMSGTAWPLSPRAEPAAKNHPEGQAGGEGGCSRTASADRRASDSDAWDSVVPRFPPGQHEKKCTVFIQEAIANPIAGALLPVPGGQRLFLPRRFIHRSCSDVVLCPCPCPLPRPSVTYIPAASRIGNRFFSRPFGLTRKAEGHIS